MGDDDLVTMGLDAWLNAYDYPSALTDVIDVDLERRKVTFMPSRQPNLNNRNERAEMSTPNPRDQAMTLEEHDRLRQQMIRDQSHAIAETQETRAGSYFFSIDRQESARSLQGLYYNSESIGVLESGSALRTTEIDNFSYRITPSSLPVGPPEISWSDPISNDEETEDYDFDNDSDSDLADPEDYTMDLEELEMYLNQLCAQTGRDFANVTLELYEKCANRNDVNKIFFETPQDSASVEIPNKNKIEIETLFKNVSPLSKLSNEIEGLSRTITDRYAHYQNAARDMINLERQLEAFKLMPDRHYFDEIQKIIDKGQWRIHFVGTDRIEFTLINDCILKWKDDSKKIDFTVNMGKFKLRYHPGLNKAHVFTYKNNLIVGSKYHPHVDGNGSVCWGNATEAITTALRCFDIGKICDVIFLLLHEYNPESPYIRLTEFAQISDYSTEDDKWLLWDWLALAHPEIQLTWLNTSNSHVFEHAKNNKRYSCFHLTNLFTGRKDGKKYLKLRPGVYKHDFIEVQDHWFIGDIDRILKTTQFPEEVKK